MMVVVTYAMAIGERRCETLGEDKFVAHDFLRVITLHLDTTVNGGMRVNS
jgi:hypothetical protein